jgi:hypothetical protein
MVQTKYVDPARLETEISVENPNVGRLVVWIGEQSLEFVVNREELERLSHQLSEQLTNVPLRPNHPLPGSPASVPSK